MKRNYEALFGAFYESYFDLKCEGMSNAEALVCTSEAYLDIQKRGEMEKSVIFIAEGRIYLTHSKIFIKAKEKIVDVLNSLDLDKLQLETTPDEYRDILERRDMVLDGIENIPVDYSPYTRWYYYEIEKEVKDYFGIIINDIKDTFELIEKVMGRFERECRSTLSEKIVVKTTLAELLIRHGIKAEKEFLKIKNELEQFDLSEVGQQLTESEKSDLNVRIKEIITKY
ncbi:Imm3 family immunity protein [Paenibacillus sp. MMS20-IR301]|uniref:Imm3 family immunity protein n=1 Tax=Paenibacillus sp. MMS20-IR301 TaxID=2895946 RepID=UPI0028E9DC93|nr:Imm3 family immunity protein [Paenibacillus sp. MMS20-IR301]WNS41055.1 Imm3 family immunity protein [Paenibacillus sp. MMS20-IR301]